MCNKYSIDAKKKSALEQVVGYFGASQTQMHIFLLYKPRRKYSFFKEVLTNVACRLMLAPKFLFGFRSEVVHIFAFHD